MSLSAETVAAFSDRLRAIDLPDAVARRARQAGAHAVIVTPGQSLAAIRAEVGPVARAIYLPGVAGDRVDLAFFELGGHSLRATRVLARIDEKVGARLAPRDLFEAPTIQAFAARLPAASSQQASADAGREELES
jgi:hypothetical protein